MPSLRTLPYVQCKSHRLTITIKTTGCSLKLCNFSIVTLKTRYIFRWIDPYKPLSQQLVVDDCLVSCNADMLFSTTTTAVLVMIHDYIEGSRTYSLSHLGLTFSYLGGEAQRHCADFYSPTPTTICSSPKHFFFFYFSRNAPLKYP